MNSKIIIFGLGLAAGACVLPLLGNSSWRNKDIKYIQLKNDYRVGEVGYLKIGTILKVDEAMSKGFTRYILYLNLGSGYDGTEGYKTEHKTNLIIPYWLMPTDTAK